jgi:hypothetical protein
MYAVTGPRFQKLRVVERRDDVTDAQRIGVFLGSEIGVQENGMALTMLSALSRRGSDPWETSRMLMKLPPKEATVKLSRLLAFMPDARLSFADSTLLACRLVLSLQDVSGFTGTPRRQEKGEMSKTGWHVVRVTVLLVAAIIGLALHIAERHSSTPHAVSSNTSTLLH